ncbi:hypothetical protein GQ600_584 [Phytophthora cactorum]|nr:hypothetical protein GQ600_584 [Phytophthora cactorum]
MAPCHDWMQDVSTAVLASASGASTFHFSKTASTDLEHLTVATQSALKPQRRLRKHDCKLDLESDDEERANSAWLSDMLVGLKAMFNKVDEMDLKAAAMITGKTPEEAKQIYYQFVDDILPTFKAMERKKFTPQSLKDHATLYQLAKNEGESLQRFY